jgi:hypothetical protein
MSVRQTRRQAALAAAGAEPTTPTPKAPKASRSDVQSEALMNGNGSAHEAPEASDDIPHENIFLFWPNIIVRDHHPPQ